MPRSAAPPDRRHLYASCWAVAQDAIFAADASTGLLVDVNPAAEALTGYCRQELVGMHRSQLFPPEEHSRTNHARCDDAIQDGDSQKLHLKLKHGGSIPVAFSSSSSVVLAGESLTICTVRDRTELEEQAHSLATLRWALSAYAGAALALGQANCTESLLQAICEAITTESAYVLAWIGSAEDGPEKPVRIVAASGSGKNDLDDLHVSWADDSENGNGSVGIAIRTGKFKIIEDIETSEYFRPWRDWARRNGIRSLVSVPLFDESGWRGALAVYAGKPNAFEPVAIEVFEHLAKEIGHGLHALHQRELLEAERICSARAQKQLAEALSATVTALVTAMETRDPYTAGHESRVADIAYAIGKELGWAEDRLQAMCMAAMVHDIGKISVPAAILAKPGRLSPEERALINKHPDTGYSVLKDIPFSWPVAEMMRQHHEKLDGSGYPQGLTADDILPEAKVLAVADIVEAMTSNRPYRQGLNLEVVLAEIESQAGTLLDAEAVRACAKLFREKKLILASESQPTIGI